MAIGKLTAAASGDEVQDLHSKLRQRGFDVPAAEVERRFFGPGTREAVTTFQRANGLKVTGAVDAATEAALGGASAAQASKPVATQSTVSRVVEPVRLSEPANGQQPRGSRSPVGQPIMPCATPRDGWRSTSCCGNARASRWMGLTTTGAMSTARSAPGCPASTSTGSSTWPTTRAGSSRPSRASATARPSRPVRRHRRADLPLGGGPPDLV